MTIENKRILFAGESLRVEWVACQRARRGLSCEECKSEHQIGIPLSGVNVRHVGGKTYTIYPSHITLSNRGEPYRVSHPYGSGETQLNIVLQDALLMNLVGAHDGVERPFSDRQRPIDAKLFLAAQCLMAAAKSQSASALELEEFVIALVEHLLGTASHCAARLTPRDLELAQHARTMLAACYSQPIALQDVAARVGSSVYHLCRVFRRTTGRTLWAELQLLRARAALLRLADGERDLTSLAFALGYSHHSHFAASFRREMGVTPSAARQLLATGSLSQVHRLLAH